MTAQRNFAALLLFLSNNNHTGDLADFGVTNFLADFFTSGVKFGADSCFEAVASDRGEVEALSKSACAHILWVLYFALESEYFGEWSVDSFHKIW
jgi:hypothetical protein